jgi:putative PIN family toxin of toxin-antitoxin system
MKLVAVLDTNVVVSAVVFGGKPREVLYACIRGMVQMAVSDILLQEIQNVLIRPKFGYSASAAHLVIDELMAIATLVHPVRKISLITEDPADNRILECAVEGQAHFVVSGDTHLLKLKRFQDIVIVNSVEFLAHLT